MRSLSKGRLIVKHFDRHDQLKSTEIIDNEAKDEGLTFLLDVVFGAKSIFQWFMGLIDSAGFVSVATTDTYLQLKAAALNWSELNPTTYEFIGNTSRRGITFDAAVAGRIANDAAPVIFTFTSDADGKSIEGIFVTSQSSFPSASGELWATALFAAPKLLSDGDRLVLTYEVTQARV